MEKHVSEMAEEQVTSIDKPSNPILSLIIGMAIIAVILRYSKKFMVRLFAFFYVNLATKYMTKYMTPFKKDFFSTLDQHKSYFEDLRKENAIRILEIGPGPGTNFQFFPKNSRVVCYDPNPHFAKPLYEHQKKFPRVNLERVVVGPAENLHGTDDKSIDIVIGTFVFCSVQDMEAVAKEVKRVLVPGGKYYFMEHIKSADGSFNQGLKTFVNPLWKFLFINCHLIRNPIPLLQNSGFAKIETKNFVMPLTEYVFNRLINDCVMGIAEK